MNELADDGSRPSMSEPSGRTIFLYAFPTLTHAIALTPLVTFIPALYAQELGFKLALVGTLLFASRFADIFIDPVIGWLSDRTRTRIGRRKPFILLGLPFMMVSCWALFVPPEHASPLYLFVALFSIYVAFSLIDIPYASWGAELATSYTTRSRISGLRHAFDQASSLLTLGLTAILTWYGTGDLRTTMRILAIVACIGIPLSFALATVLVPEPPIRAAPAQALPRRAQLALIWRNKPFVMLMGAVALFTAGGAIAASLHMLVITHVFHAPKLFAPIILAESAAAIIGIPIWIKLGDRIGKHRAAALAAIWTIVLALPYPLLGPEQLPVFVTLVSIRGLANGGLIVMIFAMAADTVDVDTAAGGRERTGTYFSVLGVATKLAIAFGVLAGTALPALSGFEPSRGPGNTGMALFVLAAVYAWLPALLKLCAIPLFWRYPLTRERQQELRAQIDGIPVGPPVSPAVVEAST